MVRRSKQTQPWEEEKKHKHHVQKLGKEVKLITKEKPNRPIKTITSYIRLGEERQRNRWGERYVRWGTLTYIKTRHTGTRKQWKKPRCDESLSKDIIINHQGLSGWEHWARWESTTPFESEEEAGWYVYLPEVFSSLMLRSDIINTDIGTGTVW